MLLHRIQVVSLSGLLCVAMAAGCNLQRSGGPQQVEDAVGSATSAEVLLPVGESLKVRINRDRDVLGLPALTASQALDEAARLRAEDMLVRGYLGPVGPGDASVAAQDLMAVAGYAGQLGELVYEHAGPLSTLTESTVGAWMASDAHRRLLLDTRFQFLGAGMAGEPEGWIVVMLFAEVGP